MCVSHTHHTDPCRMQHTRITHTCTTHTHTHTHLGKTRGRGGVHHYTHKHTHTAHTHIHTLSLSHTPWGDPWWTRDIQLRRQRYPRTSNRTWSRPLDRWVRNTPRRVSQDWYLCDMTCKWVSHVIFHMSGSCHTDTNLEIPDVMPHMMEPCHICMSHVTHVNESRYFTYEWVMSYRYQSRDARRHVIYDGVLSHIYESCHTCKWVTLFHVWVGHVV